MKMGLALCSALCLWSSNLAADSCIGFDLDVIRVDPVTWENIGYVDLEAGETLKYGERFRLKPLGEKPGVFHIWSIDPTGHKNTNFEQINSSSGTVILPCGPQNDRNTCPDSPGAPMRLVDKLESSRKNTFETELLVISYTPCANSLHGSSALTLPSCDVLVDPARDMAQAYAHLGRKELIEIDSQPRTSCAYDQDEMGNIVIHKSLEIRAERQ